MRLPVINLSLVKQFLSTILITASVGACSTIAGQKYGGAAAPNQAVNDAQCKKFANDYVRTQGIDKDWRQQEFYTQYRICMKRAAQKS